MYSSAEPTVLLFFRLSSRTTSLSAIIAHGFAHNFKEVEAKGERSADSDIASLINLLGLDNAGKTTIVKKFNGEDINSISPTLGFSIQTLEHMGYKLNIWDVGGQKSLRSYWRNYFETTDALIWVVDSSDRPRLDDCREELSKLLLEERLAGATLLVFANKQDLAASLKPSHIREALRLDDITTHHWLILGCSAVTGENLLEGINWLLKDVSSRIFSSD